jgi:Tfp pilus assembly protein FimT
MPNRTNWKTGVHSGEEGASLLEIMIVVMIIAVVTAIALPNVANSIRLYNLRSAAMRITQRLSAARSLAMAKNKNVTVSFAAGADGNVTQYGYDFSPVAADGGPDGTPDVSDPDDLTASYYTEAPQSGITVSFSAGGATLANGKGVTYTSRGELPIAATQADIRVANSSSNLTVSVNLRGQVWIH